MGIKSNSKDLWQRIAILLLLAFCLVPAAAGDESTHDTSATERSVKLNRKRRCLDEETAKFLNELPEVEVGQTSIVVEPKLWAQTRLLQGDYEVKCDVKTDRRQEPLAFSCTCKTKQAMECKIGARWKRDAICPVGESPWDNLPLAQYFVPGPHAFGEVKISEFQEDYEEMKSYFLKDKERFEVEICVRSVLRTFGGGKDICRSSAAVRSRMLPVRIYDIPCCQAIFPAPKPEFQVSNPSTAVEDAGANYAVSRDQETQVVDTWNPGMLPDEIPSASSALSHELPLDAPLPNTPAHHQ